jgi:hypothetical protein
MGPNADLDDLEQRQISCSWGEYDHDTSDNTDNDTPVWIDWLKSQNASNRTNIPPTTIPEYGIPRVGDLVSPRLPDDTALLGNWHASEDGCTMVLRIHKHNRPEVH